MEDLGKAVKIARIQKGMTQAEVAEHCNLSTEMIRSVENNRSLPSVATLRCLALCLDVSTDLILGITPKRRRRGRPRKGEVQPK